MSVDRKWCLLALIGLPGSGKTTFAKAINVELEDTCVVHVCYDELIPLERQRAIAKKDSEEDWKEARKAVSSPRSCAAW